MAVIEVALSERDINLIVDRLAERLAESGLAAGGKGGPERLYWREREAAESLGVSYGWLKQQRIRGNVRASTDGKPVLYSRADLEAVAEFLREHGNKSIVD